MNKAQEFYYYWLLRNYGLDEAIKWLIVCHQLNSA